MKKKVSFFVFCVLCFSYASTAQVSVAMDKVTSSVPKYFSYQPNFPPIFNNKLKVIPATYYTDKWSYFCDKEWKLEKSTGVPFKFRLGSVEQTDYLEGKHGH